MAHRHAAPRPPGGAHWLLVPLALALDGVAALALAGHPLPLGVIVPGAALLAAPLLVYWSLAFVAFRSWPLRSRLAALAILLGIHVGLVALHTVGYVGLWSLTGPAALRLAHSGSPLLLLLQSVWVPLLALPLVTLLRSRPAPASPRRARVRAPAQVLVSRASEAGRRRPTQPDREVRVDAGRPGIAPVAAAEAVSAARPEPAPALLPPAAEEILDEVGMAPLALASDGKLLATVPPPTWFDDLAEVSTRAVPALAPSVERVGEVRESDESAAIPVAMDPATDSEVETAVGPPRGPGQPKSEEAPGDEPLRVADPAAAVEIAARDEAVAEAASSAAKPPLDLDLVARSFAPYGSLLSRDRMVTVDLIPDPDAAVVCVVPRDISRDRVLHLAARLVRVLESVEVPSMPGPIRRLSLRGPDDVAVLTPLGGAVVVAAARRRGALALLEMLSARVVPGGAGSDAAARTPDAVPAATEDNAVTGAVRVETPGAMIDVLAPAGIAAASMGELAGRLLAVIFADGGGLDVFDTLNVMLGTHRLIVRPVQPLADPPRFVAVVGGAERPGLLGRRAERAARVLREAS